MSIDNTDISNGNSISYADINYDIITCALFCLVLVWHDTKAFVKKYSTLWFHQGHS